MKKFIIILLCLIASCDSNQNKQPSHSVEIKLNNQAELQESVQIIRHFSANNKLKELSRVRELDMLDERNYLFYMTWKSDYFRMNMHNLDSNITQDYKINFYIYDNIEGQRIFENFLSVSLKELEKIDSSISLSNGTQ